MAPKKPTAKKRSESFSTGGPEPWKLLVHPQFLRQFEELISEVEAFKTADSASYKNKKKTKLLAAILKIAFEVIPSDPASPSFLQGNTLGTRYRHWLRAKFFEGRYRLFFRYNSASRVIILAWINDEETLRTYGSKTDAYAVFASMLNKGNPPDSWDQLLKECAAAQQRLQDSLDRAKGAS